eukprot:TRINITY_DN14280_c0_g1_i1.p1 TRINITY_DN14280_c0_g1~~TRINITY_DN14280_c0_g1_i1.p1  ORF type:complete len:148 (+),score=32.76 TRINITY_DN14280_c0_g1_i1:44-445(+)
MKISLAHTLLAQGLLLIVVGVLLHYSPQEVLPYFNAGPISKDTIAVVKGWGTSMLALGLISAQMHYLDRPTAHQMVARGLTVFWALMAHGHWKMVARNSTGWAGMTPMMVVDVLFFSLDLYFSVVNTSVLRVG